MFAALPLTSETLQEFQAVLKFKVAPAAKLPILILSQNQTLLVTYRGLCVRCANRNPL